MRQIFFLACVAIIAGLLLEASGCSQPSAAQSSPGERPAATAAVDRVTAAKPARKTLKLFTSQPGRIEAFEETPLYPKIAGYVQEVLVDIGDKVKKDQTLVKLWIPEMQDEVAQKKALVAQAAAEVHQAGAAVQAAQAGIVTAQARVSQSEAGVDRANAEYDRWQSEFERIKQLAARGSVTAKLVDESQNQFYASDAERKAAAANVESAQAGLHEAEAHVSKAQADLVAAQANHRVAQANLQRAETLLGYTEIKAPYDGVVTLRNVDTGHYVHPSNGAATKPLLIVVRTDRVRVFVDVPEMEAPLVDSGDAADSAVVRIQSLQDREFNAQVTRTSWSLDPSNRSLRTEIDIPNDDGRLRAGMYAIATILLEQRDNILALPITAIVRDGRKTFCCCVNSGKITRKSIKLGLRVGDEVEVISGLDDSDTVVQARADSLKQGQAVEVIEVKE